VVGDGHVYLNFYFIIFLGDNFSVNILESLLLYKNQVDIYIK
jgi:adenosine/AMP kinase